MQKLKTTRSIQLVQICLVHPRSMQLPGFLQQVDPDKLLHPLETVVYMTSPIIGLGWEKKKHSFFVIIVTEHWKEKEK